MKQLIILFIVFGAFSIQAQTYTDYIGAGHFEGISVTTSSTESGTDPMATLNASGMEADRMDAARFLLQTTMGFDDDDITQAMDMGYEGWIDDQINLPISYMNPEIDAVWEDLQLWRAANLMDTVDVFGPAALHFHYAWWQNQMTKQDLLRQRVAFALSQIFVISSNSDLGGNAERMAYFYDKLLTGAFGNYRDLLEEVTYDISMGFYLSHLNNPKEDTLNNVHPDENYAREIMQLFSIGLYDLNNDGTRKQDAMGEDIPTYDNEDIKELAKVFTGWYPGGVNMYVTWTTEPYFGLDLWGADVSKRMLLDDDEHESSEKTILKNLVIPADQDPDLDVQMVLDTLFNHPNVGPFLGRRLIQRLVKSNPSPAYIDRVATVFNDNGQGVRGDLEAVIKAILLDSEARDCAPSMEFDAGRLIEPLVRYTHAIKSIGVFQDQGRYYNNGYSFLDDTRQQILASPTVFNFYTPDHQPVGGLAENDLYGPEYKIHNSSSAISYSNLMNYVAGISWGAPWWDWESNVDSLGNEIVDPISAPEMQVAQYLPYVQGTENVDVDELIDIMDVRLMRGETSDELRSNIREAVQEFVDRPWMEEEFRTVIVLWLLLIHPDYNVTR